MGFSIATLRTFFLYAYTSNNKTASIKTTCAQLLILGLILLPFIHISATMNGTTYANEFLIAACVLTCGINLDIIRIRRLRTAVMSNAFAVGTIAAVIYLKFIHPDANQAVYALLIQWIPTCCMNVYAVKKRLTAPTPNHATGTKNLQANILIYFSLAIFDGVILAAPGAWLSNLSTTELIRTQAVNRIFSASIALVPLIYGITHHISFQKFCASLKFPPSLMHLILTILSTSALSIAAAIIFAMVNLKFVTPEILSITIFLGASYCCFINCIRFSNFQNARKSDAILTMIVLASIFLMMLSFAINNNSAIKISAAQGLSLLLAGFFLKHRPTQQPIN